MAVSALPRVVHDVVDVDGVRVFYRAAGPVDAPTLLLLHGFPSASHQYRRLIDALGAEYRLIAPDYPGFGHTLVPDGFTHSFEALTDVIEGFVQQLGLSRFVLYAFDFGGPVGLRLAARHPGWIAGLVIQNANAYEEGLSELARSAIANRPGVPGAAERVRGLFSLEVTRGQYENGVGDPRLVAPDGWTLDQHFLDLPGRDRAQTELALDYHTNVDRYAEWQRYLRQHQPPLLIVWGRHDPFFTEAGAHAYLRDVPDAQLHLFDTGHFALEDHLDQIAPQIASFLDRVWSTTMNLAVIGATGRLGGAVLAEATDRGHQVTALSSRDVEVTDPASIVAAVTGHDAVVVSVKGSHRLVPQAARALLEALPRAGVHRLLFVGGGGSLQYAPGQCFVDSPDFPTEYRQTALDQADALDILRAAGPDCPTEWSYASPPPVHLVPGDRIGRYRAEARDTPLIDQHGQSRVTIADFAAALVDAVEQNSFVRQRFTVAY